MQCPRLDHFAKLHPPKSQFGKDAVIMGCCVMTNAPSFRSYAAMMDSQWLKNVRNIFDQDKFPSECNRCQQFEELNLESSRTHYIAQHERTVEQFGADYLTVSLMLDNICNTACQFCSPEISTKIASLMFRDYEVQDASPYYTELPLARITQLDFEGGEPSNSKNVKQVLKDLPTNVKSIRINTNCTLFMDELIPLAEDGISILLTISTDGIGKVQEYMRWPTKWDNFVNTLHQYKKFAEAYSEIVNINLHTTLTALNVYDLDNIMAFAKDSELAHSISQIDGPIALRISDTNSFTIRAKEKFSSSNDEYLMNLSKGIAVGHNNQALLDNFIGRQDALRKISITDYISR
jgi:sulfatase maturation enzyme AslB (radical SAM superfamily)